VYRPETDLTGTTARAERLRVTWPQKRVLGAHNVPVAPKSVLPQLVVAFER